MRYSTFRENGALARHETLLAAHALHFAHTHEQLKLFVREHPTVFCSHQWLAFTEPDPAGVHFRTICEVCEYLLKRDAIDADDLYVWVDYHSIPQACRYTQVLSISSLAVYASALRYFVIVTPEVLHKDTRKPCNYETYSRRGWCRLEQWARLAARGTDDLFKWTGNGL